MNYIDDLHGLQTKKYYSDSTTNGGEDGIGEHVTCVPHSHVIVYKYDIGEHGNRRIRNRQSHVYLTVTCVPHVMYDMCTFLQRFIMWDITDLTVPNNRLPANTEMFSIIVF